MFEQFKNSDGKTYNGAAALSKVTGLTQNEIIWTFNRLKKLMHTEGKTRAEALQIVTEEAKEQPWNKNES